ncbi:hypothetical protein N658DRAFT_501112 [Parathielavia hyrcaniae]|uniref:Uncharacterized protein n=1 Tax=Parathielavia hyrcaniae TaxID=113614 RepID=A0AAN6PRZ5_9PEZI|nr:hypothetical protein N658DRAFT_501112 [Parathielavia hyrcaniae]
MINDSRHWPIARFRSPIISVFRVPFLIMMFRLPFILTSDFSGRIGRHNVQLDASNSPDSELQ